MKKNKKLTIYVALSGGFGPLAQVLPTLEKIKEDGHDIICSSTSKAAVKKLEEMGYKILNFPLFELPENIIPKGPDWWNLDFYWGRQGYLDYDYVSKLVASRVEVIKGIQPDIIITMFNPPASIAARILGIPLVSFTQSCMHPDGKVVSWWKEPTFEYTSASIAVNRVLDDWGKQPIERMEDLNKGDLTIIASFPEFDPVSDPNTIFIGPSSWNVQGKSNHDDNIISQHNKPFIYAYTGHMHDTAGPSGQKILESVIGAFNDTTLNVVVSTGTDQHLENTPLTTNNITITDWISIPKIAEDCDLMIHHGGHGSCMSSLIYGIPSLVIPTFSEREFNARQLEELGIGIFIPPTELTSERLFLETEKCLENKSLYTNAKNWSRKLGEKALGGPEKAKEHILNLFYK